MTRFIEIDEKTYTFENCFDCPLYEGVEGSLSVFCNHPEGIDVYARFQDYTYKDGRYKQNWFPKGCPARKICKGMMI